MTLAVPPPNWNSPIVDGRGFPSNWFREFLQAHFRALSVDLPATTATANAAAPGSAQVVASGGLKGGGPIGPNAGLSFYVVLTTVALLPTSGMAVGDWAYALDGRKTGEGSGAGTGVPVFWSNGAWNAVDSGAAVAA